MINYAQPVTGKDFFAREDILSELAKSTANIKEGYRRNIAIVGSSLIGKSSLLLHYLGTLNDDKDLIPVYLDMQSTGIKEFLEKLISSAFYNALKKNGDMLQITDTKMLLQAARRHFPRTCDLSQRVLALADEGSMDDAFSEAWDILAFLAAESGRFIVMVIDEFHKLSGLDTSKPFQVLGCKIMTQQKTLFVFSSSSAVTAKKILSERLSLLFGGFKVIDICPFNPSQAREFIQTRLKGIVIPKTLIDFIVSFTGGHPFYLKSIVDKINLVNTYGVGKITTKRLSSIMAELLFYPGGVLNQFFCDKIEEINSFVPGTSVLDILRSFTSTGCFSEISCRNTLALSELHTITTSLLELGFLQKSGSLYAITDPMLRMWVEVKSKSRNLCFDFIPKQEWDDYSDEIQARIVYFKAEQLKGLDKKVIEIINSFNNDQFFIDERVRVLPKVKNIDVKKYKNYDMIMADTSRKNCYFILCRKNINEEDIAGMYRRLKSPKRPIPKVVVITCAGIEPPARLLAKQKSFCIWDGTDFARLFNFYKGYNTLIA